MNWGSKHDNDGDLSDTSSDLGEYLGALTLEDKDDRKETKKKLVRHKTIYDDDDDSSAFEEEEEDSVARDEHSVSGKKNDDEDSAWEFDRRTEEYFLSSSKVADVRWPPLRLPKNFYNMLYDFQRVGVQWMASLHDEGIGGILGDDMGMGKSVTTLAYVGGLMRAGTIRNALIVAPKSVLRSWEKEANRFLRKCVPVEIHVVSSETNKNTRKRRLQKAMESANPKKRNPFYLIITTYGLIRSAEADFRSNEKNSYWNYVICDEAHNIKNPNAGVSLSCRVVCEDSRTRRFMLTGTPIMNRLNELWALFDFATLGRVLGDLRSFRFYYAQPIEAARERTASEAVIQHGERKIHELHDLLKPHFMQRLKADFLKNHLPPKLEIVVWTHLSPQQRNMYQAYVDSEDSAARAALTGEKTSPLEAIAWLKKLCGHPQLVSDEHRSFGSEEIVAQSAKLSLLLGLIKHLKASKHRTLIFSQSTKMLDIIEQVLDDNDVFLTRIDGQTRERDRQDYVDDFNQPDSTTEVMLLSTKAAGVGLTLTGADTVVVYDPSWTPAEDSQAVDRAYRLGQKKPVTVYRLIAAGTVEEKMYERQIYKDGIRRTVLSDNQNVQRYFSQNELSAMFKLAPIGVCEVMSKLHEESLKTRMKLNGQDDVLAMDGVLGMSRHDGFYTVSKKASDSPSSGEGKAKGFGGSRKNAPKVIGKSQRVLNKVTPNIEYSQPSANVPAVAKAPQASNTTGVAPQSVPALIHSMENLPPRKSLQVALDVLENRYPSLTKDEKMKVHANISKQAYATGLLKHD